jgi:archaellum biogenesis ATPase FlaH|tara:strand:- start:5309 stop:5500 length:192 start_codon:yes stop_codon:yes gene_type:complete
MEKSYIIKKIMADAKGKKTHVLLVDSQSELLELDSLKNAEELINILNGNSDSGWVYEIIEVKK